MRTLAVAAAIGALALAGTVLHPWQAKPVAEWTEADARQVLSDSPWSKQVDVRFDDSPDFPTPPDAASPGGGIHGSVGGTVMTGGGVRGMGTGGTVQGGIPGRQSNDPDLGPLPPPSRGPAGPPVTITIRWESAMPVREAEMKLRQDPLGASQNSYVIALLGVPDHIANYDPQGLRSRAWLKGKGRKKIAPAAVKLVVRDEKPVLLLFFPRSEEITQSDKEIEFSVRLGASQLKQKFLPNEMTYAGKLEF